MMAKGDALASGAKSATFAMPKVTQAEWDARVGKPTKPKEESGRSNISAA